MESTSELSDRAGQTSEATKQGDRHWNSVGSRQEGRAAPCPLTCTAAAERASNARASFTPVIVGRYGGGEGLLVQIMLAEISLTLECTTFATLLLLLTAVPPGLV